MRTYVIWWGLTALFVAGVLLTHYLASRKPAQLVDPHAAMLSRGAEIAAEKDVVFRGSYTDPSGARSEVTIAPPAGAIDAKNLSLGERSEETG